MSASEEMIAAEAGRLSLFDKKASLAEDHARALSPPPSSSNEQGCPCLKNPPYAYQQFPGYCFPPQPYFIPPWGGFITPPTPCPCLMQRMCIPPPCYSWKCSLGKGPAKSRKASKIEQAPSKGEKSCACCHSGKCECCKSGKECGKGDDKADETYNKNGDESEDEGDEQGDEEEE